MILKENAIVHLPTRSGNQGLPTVQTSDDRDREGGGVSAFVFTLEASARLMRSVDTQPHCTHAQKHIEETH